MTHTFMLIVTKEAHSFMDGYPILYSGGLRGRGGPYSHADNVRPTAGRVDRYEQANKVVNVLST